MTKRRHKTERRKALGDFMLLLLVVAVVAAIVLVGEFVWNLAPVVFNRGVNIPAKLEIFMLNDDIGTELVSLLNAKTSDVKHMELLGRYVADGIAEGKAARIDPVKATMDSAYAHYDFTFTAAGGNFIKYNEGVPTAIEDKTRKAILNCPPSFQAVPEDLKKKILDNGGLKWPTDSKVITSGFGGRDLGDGKCNCHGGIDIGGREANVYATAPGTVVFTGKYGDSGNLIVIGHPSSGVVSAGHPEKYDYYTFYGHLSDNSIAVKAGESISVAGKDGKAIGKSGNTGFTVGATGYHLHFELGTADRPADKTAINPCGLLDLAGVTGLKCDHEEVAACKYVAGTVAGKSVRSYETDIPLPGAKSGAAKGTITFKQWD